MSSGVTITWTHRAIVSGDRHQVTISLISTIGYGLFFSAIQFYEYNVAPFSINDSVYGTLFFILTGFHGLHSAPFKFIIGLKFTKIDKILTLVLLKS